MESSPLLTPRDLELDPGLDEAGFNAVGVLTVCRYDELVADSWRSAALLPGARSAVVLACGGPAFGEAFQRSPEVGLAEHPIDHFASRIVEAAAGALRRRGAPTRAIYYWQNRDGTFADFVVLARAAGLGLASRLGMLIHPTYGPWISLRAALLTELELRPTAKEPGFTGCEACQAPCSRACPGNAIGREAFDTAVCAATTRRLESCRTRCAARHACVIGREHIYPRDLERQYRAPVIPIYDAG